MPRYFRPARLREGTWHPRHPCPLSPAAAFWAHLFHLALDQDRAA
ncbi:hypothetical protein ABT354_13390 [Streptomyces sp. NPDC000594]